MDGVVVVQSKHNRFLPTAKAVSQNTYISERFLFLPKLLRVCLPLQTNLFIWPNICLRDKT